MILNRDGDSFEYAGVTYIDIYRNARECQGFHDVGATLWWKIINLVTSQKKRGRYRNDICLSCHYFFAFRI